MYTTHMDQAIFHLKASVPATSLYLLITATLDEGEKPTLDRMRGLWNGTEDDLTRAIDELTQRGVLHPPKHSSNGNPVWLDLNSKWRKIVTPRNASRNGNHHTP